MIWTLYRVPWFSLVNDGTNNPGTVQAQGLFARFETQPNLPHLDVHLLHCLWARHQLWPTARLPLHPAFQRVRGSSCYEVPQLRLVQPWVSVILIEFPHFDFNSLHSESFNRISIVVVLQLRIPHFASILSTFNHSIKSQLLLCFSCEISF